MPKEPSASWREWKPYTTELTPDGGRTLEEYQNFFKIEDKDLEDKTVLDLGSGEGERFNEDIKRKGLNTKVVSVNPDYSISRYRADIAPIEGSGMSVAAIGQELPFQNETFDLVLAFETVSRYSSPETNFDAAVKWSSESFRVLKQNGKAEFIDLVNYNQEDVTTQAWNKLIEDLNKKGIDAKIEKFTPAGFPPEAVFHKLVIKKHAKET